MSCACKRAGRQRQDGFEFVALGLANLPFWLKVLLTYAKLKVLRTYAKLAAILKRQGLLRLGQVFNRKVYVMHV